MAFLKAEKNMKTMVAVLFAVISVAFFVSCNDNNVENNTAVNTASVNEWADISVGQPTESDIRLFESGLTVNIIVGESEIDNPEVCTETEYCSKLKAGVEERLNPLLKKYSLAQIVESFHDYGIVQYDVTPKSGKGLVTYLCRRAYKAFYTNMIYDMSVGFDYKDVKL